MADMLDVLAALVPEAVPGVLHVFCRCCHVKLTKGQRVLGYCKRCAGGRS